LTAGKILNHLEKLKTKTVVSSHPVYLHHVYIHATDYFTKRQSTLPFRGIYVVGIEAFICIYGKLLFPKQYVHPFFGEPENNLLSLEQ
jgi:hypothetical protein